jgi:hypothetical protein
MKMHLGAWCIEWSRCGRFAALPFGKCLRHVGVRFSLCGICLASIDLHSTAGQHGDVSQYGCER